MVGRVTHSFTHSLAWPLFLSPLMPGPGLWLDQMAQRVLLLPDLEWGQEKGFGSVPEWGTVSGMMRRWAWWEGLSRQGKPW